MKILYTHRTRGKGAEGVHIMGMVEAFREEGHEVVVDGPAGCDPFEVNGLAPDTSAGRTWLAMGQRIVAEHTPQVLFSVVELLYNVPVYWRLWRRLKSFRPDLVYERYAVGNAAPGLVCRVHRVPRISEVNDSVVIERSRPLSLAAAKRLIEKHSLRTADMIVTISQDFKRRLVMAYGVPSADILVCPNAVSVHRFTKPSNDRLKVLRRRWGLEGRVVIGSAGQFVPWHGLAPFVSSMGAFVRDTNAVLLFIGDGPVRSEVTDAARAAGIGDRVIFTGMVPHSKIPEHLALLDIAVIPFSNAHGSPMKLMEFMAMGLPVVAPDLSPVREVLTDGATGLLFRQGDMEDMRRVLARIVGDGEAAKALGARAKDFVCQHLTWAVHARACLHWYGQIASTGGEITSLQQRRGSDGAGRASEGGDAS